MAEILDEVAPWLPAAHQADAPILAAAVAGQVDYLVTGNTRHFPANHEAVRRAGLKIVTPAQLVSLLEFTS